MQIEPMAISVGLFSTVLPLAMNLPLWGLVIFMLWTIAVVVLLLIVRIRHLARGGSIKDFAIASEENLLWRLFRVQANLIENLPLYIGTVFLLTVRGVTGIGIDILVSLYIGLRLLHSIIHIAGANPNLRLLCLIGQLGSLVSLIALAIFGVAPSIAN